MLFTKPSSVSGNVEFNRTQVKFLEYFHVVLFIPRTSAFLAELSVPIAHPDLVLQIRLPKSDQNFLQKHVSNWCRHPIWKADTWVGSLASLAYSNSILHHLFPRRVSWPRGCREHWVRTFWNCLGRTNMSYGRDCMVYGAREKEL